MHEISTMTHHFIKLYIRSLMPQDFHENFGRAEDVPLSSHRSFCLWFCAIFLIIGLLHLYYDTSTVIWFTLALLFLAVGLARPSLAAPLNRGWQKLGFLLARLTNPLFLMLIYVTTMVPMGLCMQLLGKDPLRLKPSQKNSFWIERTPPGPAPETMPHQF
jgi:hypothetical protein